MIEEILRSTLRTELMIKNIVKILTHSTDTEINKYHKKVWDSVEELRQGDNENDKDR